MKTKDDGFRAGDLFHAIERLPENSREIIGLVRPHPDHDNRLQIAHPSQPDEWHDVEENAVAGFTPLRSVSRASAIGLARLFLRDGAEHPLAPPVAATPDGTPGALDAWVSRGNVSVVSGGAQYCYYDAALHGTVCVPI